MLCWPLGTWDKALRIQCTIRTQSTHSALACRLPSSGRRLPSRASQAGQCDQTVSEGGELDGQHKGGAVRCPTRDRQWWRKAGPSARCSSAPATAQTGWTRPIAACAMTGPFLLAAITAIRLENSHACCHLCRVSTERQERQQTITSQLAALQAWAEAAGRDLSERHVFRDEGYSGSRLDRPGLDALRDAVRDGEVDVVAVVSPDRLARKYAYQALLLEEIRRAGCAIEFLNHAIGDNPGDQLLLQIQGAVAEYERALLSERFRRGKLQKARAGQFIGVRAPYGYHSTGRSLNGAGRLVINEAEAELVRLLYGWLIDEQLSIRQILRRLNFGPWFPRSGRRPWSPSVVQHILSDPVYVGTAYANRYEYVAAKKPRSVRKPSYSGKGCRKLRPKEQWIPIPVPAIISPDRWDHAQAQLARNAALSFRNNQKHNHLLRCLLTCGACGLAMHGVMRRTSAGGEHRYYRCAGKDCVHTARATPCPRAQVDGSHLERVVWDHILTLLVEPEQLLAQYERFASGADPASRREQASEQQLQARLDRLARTNCRLLDAYQAEAISLDELRERRAQLAEQRLARISHSRICAEDRASGFVADCA